MKKLFIVFMSLIFTMCLVGCDEKEEKVNIDFIIDGKSYLVKIDKGTSISKDKIPLSTEEEVVQLYYDENMENEYDDEIINEDSKMYVKNMGEEKLYNEVCEAYLNEFIKPIRENSTVEDVWVFEYLGTYGESYVAIILDRQNCIFLDIVYRFEIEDLKFTYSEGYIIYVYNNGELMPLSMAYENNLLSYDNIVQIHNNYYRKK